MFVLLGNEICFKIIWISYTYENYINPSISTSLEHNIDWQKTFHLYHFPPVFGLHPKRSQAPQGNDKTITCSPPILLYPLQVKINPLANTFVIYFFIKGLKMVQFSLFQKTYVYVFLIGLKIFGIVIFLLSIKGAIYTIHLKISPSERL